MNLRPPALLLAIIYLGFISLGLPDGTVGAVWPRMHRDLGLPIEVAGLFVVVATVLAAVAAFSSGRIIARWATAPLVIVSCGLSGLGLLMLAQAQGLVWLMLAALPLGLGSGAVDAALNGSNVREERSAADCCPHWLGDWFGKRGQAAVGSLTGWALSVSIWFDGLKITTAENRLSGRIVSLIELKCERIGDANISGPRNYSGFVNLHPILEAADWTRAAPQQASKLDDGSGRQNAQLHHFWPSDPRWCNENNIIVVTGAKVSLDSADQQLFENAVVLPAAAKWDTSFRKLDTATDERDGDGYDDGCGFHVFAQRFRSATRGG